MDKNNCLAFAQKLVEDDIKKAEEKNKPRVLSKEEFLLYVKRIIGDGQPNDK